MSQFAAFMVVVCALAFLSGLVVGLTSCMLSSRISRWEESWYDRDC